jgi:hypothetical protein
MGRRFGVSDATGTGEKYAADLQSVALARIGAGMSTQIVEIVVVKGTTSENDLAHLEAYLKTKYGL